MNKTKTRQMEIAKNMLEVEIPMDEIVMISGLSMEEVEKLSKETVIRVRDAEDVVNFDLKDVLYHYDKDAAVKVDEEGKAVVFSKEKDSTEDAAKEAE